MHGKFGELPDLEQYFKGLKGLGVHMTKGVKPAVLVVLAGMLHRNPALRITAADAHLGLRCAIEQEDPHGSLWTSR